MKSTSPPRIHPPVQPPWASAPSTASFWRAFSEVAYLPRSGRSVERAFGEHGHDTE